MPADHAAQGAVHLIAESLAAIVLLAGGLAILGLQFRHRRTRSSSGRSSLATEAPDPVHIVASLPALLVVVSGTLALTGLVLLVGGSVQVGTAFVVAAVPALAAARIAHGQPERFDPARLLALRNALSILVVPLVGSAFVWVLVTLAVPSATAGAHPH